MKFAATFTPGMGELVVRQLKRQPLQKLRLTYQEDGLVVGDTTLPAGWLGDVRFWHNAFVVLEDATQITSVEALSTRITMASMRRLLECAPVGVHTVQLRTMDAGQPVTLSGSQRRTIEKLLVSAGLQAASHRADCELWLLRRASGYGFVGLRWPRARFKRRPLAPGELRPELAHLLCLAAGVTGSDVVLDPFTGHGAIPRELVAGFSPNQVIAIEQEPRLLGKLQILAKEKPSLRVLSGDALHMNEILPDSISRIVTDPPWGDYARIPGDIEGFYAQMCQEFARVLKPGGVAVVLTNAKDILTATSTQASLEVVKQYDILVSGKKASVVKLRKSIVTTEKTQ
ncbi:MAG TPA: hypothetical protein VLF60_01015 [Candidatus Saccharimonadales bacterium]|nr:hypothetical protein [Candidatus Saccharimonadales bacterium]